MPNCLDAQIACKNWIGRKILRWSFFGHFWKKSIWRPCRPSNISSFSRKSEQSPNIGISCFRVLQNISNLKNVVIIHLISAFNDSNLGTLARNFVPSTYFVEKTSAIACNSNKKLTITLTPELPGLGASCLTTVCKPPETLADFWHFIIVGDRIKFYGDFDENNVSWPNCCYWIHIFSLARFLLFTTCQRKMNLKLLATSLENM